MRRVSALASVVRVREALTDGDLALAVQLLADLEADLRPRSRSVCPECRQDFRFPGPLEEHLRVFHPEIWEATVAA